MISWFQWLKLVEFALFYFYLKNYALRRFDWTKSAYAIVAGGVFQAVIAIAQFFKQSSLGLGYLGESLVSVDLRGTAYFLTMTGEKIVRAYGTTPHPNVLAGYLLLVLSILYFIFCIKKIISCKNYLLFTISYGLILFAFFLTFSRIVIFAWAVAFMVGTLIYQKKYPQQIKNIFLITLFVILVFTILYWPEILSRLTIASGDEGLLVRKQYAQDIVRSDLTIFGVGIGNFVNWFSERNPMEADWLYQPVHNIYLLIYSETGLFGLSVFLLFLLSLIKESVSNKKLVFCLLPAPYRTCSCAGLLVPFLFVGFFDHFLWTLQQGRLIFWLVLTISSLGDIMRLQNFERR